MEASGKGKMVPPKPPPEENFTLFLKPEKTDEGITQLLFKIGICNFLFKQLALCKSLCPSNSPFFYFPKYTYAHITAPSGKCEKRIMGFVMGIFLVGFTLSG